MSERHSGQCACGAIRFAVTGPGRAACYCHCESCRRASGAPFIAWVTFPVAGYSLHRGRPAVFRSSERVERGFCADCGATLTYAHSGRPEEIDIATAVLDDAARFAPEAHIWVADKPDWVRIGDDLPQYAGWRTPG